MTKLYNKTFFFFLYLIFFSSPKIFAQDDDLFNLLEEEMGKKTEYTIATFKATRIVNSHSIERMQKRNLDFRVSHRFGKLNSGASEFWGMDNANTYLSLEYGINDFIMFGLGRSTYEKTFNSFLKFSILRQCIGKKNIPISVSFIASAEMTSNKWKEPERKNHTASRLSYIYQILAARKFSNEFSFQISPTLIHKNLVSKKDDNNDIFALGLGGRYKITNRTSVNFEYFYIINPNACSFDKYTNPISIGFDFETGSHVFQLYLTNSIGITEKSLFTETTGDFFDGDIHFGFNISRVFNF